MKKRIKERKKKGGGRGEGRVREKTEGERRLRDGRWRKHKKSVITGSIPTVVLSHAQ